MRKTLPIWGIVFLCNYLFAQTDEVCLLGGIGAPTLCANNNNTLVSASIPATATNNNSYPTPTGCTGGGGGNGGYVNSPTAGGDVWFRIYLEQTPTAANQLVINTTSGTLTDIAMAVYTATDPCNPASFTQVACNRDKSAVNFMTRLAITSGVGGTYLYVRVWDENQNQTGTFNIQVDYTSTLDKMDELDGLTTYVQKSSCPRYFYDDGGRGSLKFDGTPTIDGEMGQGGMYTNNKNYTTTYCAEKNTEAVVIDFGFYLDNADGINQMELQANVNGNDYLYFYDGATTAANLIGVYTGSTGSYPQPGKMISSGRCLTVQFVSDNNSGIVADSEGWGGTVQAVDATQVLPTVNVTCGSTVNFTDTGGSSGNYSDDENYAVTYCPATAGQAVWASFTPNAGWETNYDYLYIYDGNSITSPLLNIYTGGVNTRFTATDVNTLGIIKPTITNVSGCLTFRFTSDFSVTKSGWDATISCGDKRLANGGEDCANATTLIVPGTHAGMTVNSTGNPNGGTPLKGTGIGQVDPTLPLGGGTCQPTQTSASNVTREENTLWYRFEVPATVCATAKFGLQFQNISCQNIDAAGGGSGAQFVVFKTNSCQTAAGWASTLEYCHDKITPATGAVTFPAAGSLTPGDVYYIMIDGFTGQHCNFDMITAISSGPDCDIYFPVEFGDFHAKWLGDQVKLDWVTFSETNAANFQVERSIDGIDFVPISQLIPAYGNTDEMQIYQATDPEALDLNRAVLYYRIRQTDIDDAVIHTRTEKVNIPVYSEQTRIYPNPAQDYLNLSFSQTQEGVGNLQIFNSVGKVVHQQKLQSQTGRNSYKILVSDLPDGQYFLQVQVGSLYLSEKIWVKH